MRRIAIIGPRGSGKSRLARQLSEALGIRVIHLDRLFWKPNWVVPDPAEWEAIQRRELADDPWVVDGPPDDDTAHLWLDAADTIVFLDTSPLTCIWGVTRRRLDSQDGPEMPAGCDPAPFHHAFVKFLRYLWRYRRTTRAEILADLAGRRGGPQIVVLQRGHDVREFLTEVHEPARATARA